MYRIVRPELLDGLPASNPRALRSRRDIRRINAWMGNARQMARALFGAGDEPAPERIAELGAGDGEFLFSVAKRSQRRKHGVKTRAVLVDKHHLLRDKTRARFTAVGWIVRSVAADVFCYLDDHPDRADATLANLFLHHFETESLKRMLDLASRGTKVFVAVEPRRAGLPFLFSQMLWGLGCNSVTRNDAPISVRAGFSDGELSALWPDDENWTLVERRAGLFSHFFMAQRKR